MNVKGSQSTEPTTNISRRDMMASSAAAAVSAALPKFADAQSIPARERPFGAIYQDPTYKCTFAQAYSLAKISAVHSLILQNFPVRNSLTWGAYQRLVVPDPALWGSQHAFDEWPDHVEVTRNNLEKQPAHFANPENAMNPFDTRQVAENLKDHIDEVVRIALWDHSVPIKIKVGRRRSRNHGMTTTWSPTPSAGSNPNLQLTGLTITIACPEGGWQGYTTWLNSWSGVGMISEFVAKWQVPAAPAVKGQQILFLFNGLESVSRLNAVGGILQPVLQWTSAGWLVRSMYMRADFDPTANSNSTLPLAGAAKSNYNTSGAGGTDNRTYSKGIFVQTGQTITGSINMIGLDVSTGMPTYHCSIGVNGVNKTQAGLTTPGIPELVYARCAIESYDIPATTSATKKRYYPAGLLSFSSIDLKVNQGAINPVVWVPNKTDLGSDYIAAANSGGDTVTLTPV